MDAVPKTATATATMLKVTVGVRCPTKKAARPKQKNNPTVLK
jgi:hypothetical protein